MRKACSLLILLLSTLCVPSLLTSRLLDLSFIALNDAMTVGIAQNEDDLRSYGALLSAQFTSGIYAKVETAGLTMRESLVPDEGSRYDELLIDAGYSHTFTLDKKVIDIDYTLSGSAGLVLAGNLGFQTVQNTWHEFANIPQVFLPYSQGDDLSVYPRFLQSQLVTGSFDVPGFTRTSPYLAIGQVFEYAPQYGYGYSVTASLGQRDEVTQDLAIGIGYAASYTLDDVPLHDLTAQSESGIFMHMVGRMGLLDVLFRAYMESGRGWGGIGFHTGYPEVNREESASDDFSLCLGMTFPSRSMALGFSYYLGDHIRLMFCNAFDDSILDITDNSRQNISWWRSGIKWRAGDPDWIISPFLSLSGGVRRTSVFTNDALRETRVREFDAFTPLINSEAGVLLFSNGQFSMKGVSYGIECATGLTYSPSDHLADTVAFYGLENIRTLDWYARVSLVMSGAL